MAVDKPRVAARSDIQICRARDAPYRRVSSRRSLSGSCINSAVLAVVLPAATAPASSNATLIPASLKR